MRVLLVQPPQCDPAQPYSSLSHLLGAWRAAGLQVDAVDANLGFFNYLCSPGFLREAVARAERRLAAPAPGDENARRTLERALSGRDWVADLAPQAIAALRDPAAFYDPRTYAWAFRVIHRALEVASASVYPGRVTLQAFHTAHSHLSSRGVLAASRDEQTNLFLEYTDRSLGTALAEARPDVIAVSVTFPSQIIPAWTLAAKARRWLPDVRVVFGGATVTRMRDALLRTPELFRDLDAMVVFEGETAFPALLEEWAQGRDGASAPNVLLPRNGQVVQSGRTHVENLDALPSPDHRGLPLADYWTPAPALLLNTSRGCYHGRCAFCAISPATWGPQRVGRAFRVRSTEAVVCDLAVIRGQTGARAVNLSNDVLPPRLLGDLGDAIAASGLDVTWDTEIRLERALTGKVLRRMADGGCRHLRFGFESAAQRVRGLMGKSTDVAETTRIIRQCTEVGISVSLMCLIGFPGERPDEAAQTAAYLAEHRNHVVFVSLAPFALESGSGVHERPSEYGVEVLPDAEADDLSWMHRYRAADGGSVERTAELLDSLEARLDRVIPDRDLFFKGGLGHAHTTLYTRRFGPGCFGEWNQAPLRRAPKGEVPRLRTARRLSLQRSARDAGLSGWSEFVVSAGEVPESVARLGGELLVLLAAALEPQPAEALVRLCGRLLGGDRPSQEAEDLVGQLLDVGLLLAANGDPREVSDRERLLAPSGA